MGSYLGYEEPCMEASGMEGAAEAGQPLAGGRWSARYPSGTTGAGGRWSALGSAARIAAAATDHCSSGRSCRQDRERERAI